MITLNHCTVVMKLRMNLNVIDNVLNSFINSFYVIVMGIIECERIFARIFKACLRSKWKKITPNLVRCENILILTENIEKLKSDQ